jgi:hypothetical protein
MALVGALFIVIGNYMGKFTRNFVMGIRSPWTLSNDEVWLRTHRLGGKVFVVCGLAVIGAVLLDQGAVALGVMLAAALIPAVYSYIVYRKVSNAWEGAEDPPGTARSERSQPQIRRGFRGSPDEQAGRRLGRINQNFGLLVA